LGMRHTWSLSYLHFLAIAGGYVVYNLIRKSS
jgi:hypothetical protein